MSPRSAEKKPFSLWMVTAFVLGILALFIGISFAQELRRRVALQRHVEQLRQEIRSREQKIADVRQFSEYLKTDAYKERAAREKLNYQKPGEQVVVVPSGAVSGATASAEVPRGEVPMPIPRQWWNLIFPDPQW